MKLSRKTFVYSISVAFLLVACIVLYFLFMLPSLYVEYTEKSNLDSVAEVQKGYMKERSYKDLSVKNPTGSLSLEIPMEGNEVYIAGKAFKITIQAEDEELRSLLTQIQEVFRNIKDISDIEEAELPDIDWDLLKQKLFPESNPENPDAVTIQAQIIDKDGGFVEKQHKVHVISDSIVVFEGGVTDGENEYISYIAAGITKDALIFSMLPTVKPQITEIRPIVLGSLPMIVAIAFLLMLMVSRLFSKRIVDPVIRLACYAQDVKEAGIHDMEPLEMKGQDEIAELGVILNELYERLRQQYQELEQNNQALLQENKRQEVFLRASSHQLKTPITAALLLVDGMTGQIGKYSDTGKYLPEVRKQLQSMRKIVEDILYLNHCAGNIRLEQADLFGLLKENLEHYRIPFSERGLDIRVSGENGLVETDRGIMNKMIDNLLSNVVSYTPEGERVEITADRCSIEIYNHGVQIEEELLPHIYEPFVSSDIRNKGRGLGLYVNAYYAEVLGYKITVRNAEDGVVSRLDIKHTE